MRPLGGRLMNRSPARITCHCLLVEASGGLVLVNAGAGVQDMRYPSEFEQLSSTTVT